MSTKLPRSCTRYRSLSVFLGSLLYSEEAGEQCDKNDRECFENFKELGRECADKCDAVAVPAIRKTENTQKECENKCKTTFSEKAKAKCEKITSSYEKITSKCMATKCSKKSCKARW